MRVGDGVGGVGEGLVAVVVKVGKLKWELRCDDSESPERKRKKRKKRKRKEVLIKGSVPLCGEVLAADCAIRWDGMEYDDSELGQDIRPPAHVSVLPSSSASNLVRAKPQKPYTRTLRKCMYGMGIGTYFQPKGLVWWRLNTDWRRRAI